MWRLKIINFVHHVNEIYLVICMNQAVWKSMCSGELIELSLVAISPLSYNQYYGEDHVMTT